MAAIAAESIGANKVVGISLPTRYTSQESIVLAKEQANALSIPFLQINADLPFSGAVTTLADAFPDRNFCLTDENL